MKQKSLLRSMLLLFALIVGSTSAWADDEVYKTALFGSSYNTKGVSGYTGVSFDATNNGFTVNVANFNNNNNGWNYIKCGGKNGAYTGTIITDAFIDKAVTKVVLTIDAITAGNVTSMTLYTSTNKSTWTSVGTFDKSTGAKTVTLSTPTENLYYKIEIVCTQGSSNGLVTVSKVEYYYDSGATPDPSVATTLTIDATGITNTDVYEGTAAGSLSATVTAGGDAVPEATVTWSSSNTSVATIDEDGIVTLVAAGSTTITASYAGDANYQASSATYDLTVTDSTPLEGDILNLEFTGVSGTTYSNWTEKEGLSGAVYAGNSAGDHDAIQLRSKDNSGIVTTNSVGYVKKVSVKWNSYTANDRTIDIYGKNSAYSAASDLYSTSTQGTKLGSIVCGSSTVLNISGDYEYIGIRSNNGALYLDEIGIKWEASTKTPTTTTISDAGITNTDVYAGTNAGTLSATVTVTEGGAAVSGATVSWASSNTNVATINASTGAVTLVAAGTTTITASYDGNGDYMSSSASYELTVTSSAPVLDYATLPFSWNSNYGTAPEGITNEGVGTGGSGNNTYLKFDGSGDYIVLKIDERPGTLTFNIKGNANTAGSPISGTFKIQTSTDGTNYVDFDSYVNLSSTAQSITIANLSANVRYIKWIYAEKISGNVALSNIALEKYVVPTTVTATIATSGYTTFCSPYDLSFEGVDNLDAAYVVSQSTDAVAKLKKVTAVPAGTGVVLKGTAGAVTIPVEEYTGEEIFNLLVGTLKTTFVTTETVYVVSGGKFMLFAGTSIPAHKAYLPVSAIGGGAPSLSFEFDDETTSIQNIERTINDNQYYTLDGRRVAEPTKGLYILNGRKVIVK